MAKVNGKKVTLTNQLHDIKDWNEDNLIFSDPELVSNPPISYYSIKTLTINHQLDEDGNVMYDKPESDETRKPLNSNTIGKIYLKFYKMFTFGVSESLSTDTKEVVGHSMSHCLWSRDGVQEHEIKTSDKLERLITRVKEHLIKIRKDLKAPKLDMTDLKDMDKMLWWKKDEDGEREKDQGPTFAPKLLETKKRKDNKTGKEIPGKMLCAFYLEDEVDENGDPIEVNPLDYLSIDTKKKYFHSTSVVLIDDIFFAAKNKTIRTKITEAEIKELEVGPKRFLHGRNKIKESKKLNISTSTINPLIKNTDVLINDDNSSDLELKDEPELKDESEPELKEEIVEPKQKKVVKNKKNKE